MSKKREQPQEEQPQEEQPRKAAPRGIEPRFALAPSQAEAGTPRLKLSDLCRVFQVSEREALYVLTHGGLPSSSLSQPGSGHHRVFTPREAWELLLILELKAAGLKVPVAADVVRWLFQSVEEGTSAGIAVGAGGRRKPADDARWMLEIVRGALVRFVRADLAQSARLPPPGPWTNVLTQQRIDSSPASVVVRVDLSALAAQLQSLAPAESSKRPRNRLISAENS